MERQGTPRAGTRTALRAGMLALTLWGLLSALGLATERIAFVDEPGEPGAAPSQDGDDSDRARPAPEDPPTVQPASGAGTKPSEAAVPGRRFAVCGREEAPPRLIDLSNPAGALREPALWAVSCGSSVHVVAFDADDAVGAPGSARVPALIARRVARLSLPSPAPDHAPRPAPIIRLDGSWLVATLRSDRNGSPVGGALFRVPFASGAGLSAPSARVHDAAPGDLIAATFDREPGQDFALLQLGEARASQPSELWMFSGGPSPVRTQRVPIDLGASVLATLGAHLLASLDLDGDSIDEVVVLSPGTGRLTIVTATPAAAGDAKAAPKTALSLPIQIPVPGGEAVYALDLDADDTRELVIAGKTAYVVRAKGGAPSEAPSDAPPPGAPAEGISVAAVPVPALDGLRDLALLDTNADGKPELVGYAHPELIAVSDALGTRGPAGRSRLVVLRGSGLSVLDARLVHLDGDGALDAIVLATSEGADPQVELLVAQHVEPLVSPNDGGNRENQASIRAAGPYPLSVPPSATALRNVALVRDIELR